MDVTHTNAPKTLRWKNGNAPQSREPGESAFLVFFFFTVSHIFSVEHGTHALALFPANSFSDQSYLFSCSLSFPSESLKPGQASAGCPSRRGPRSSGSGLLLAVPRGVG